MLTPKQAGEMAAALPGVTVRDHFGSDAYRTDGGIFATVWHATKTVNLRLTVEQQRRFVGIGRRGFRRDRQRVGSARLDDRESRVLGARRFRRCGEDSVGELGAERESSSIEEEKTSR